MYKKLPFSRVILALSMSAFASTATAAIKYHRLVWDKTPAHQATIGFSLSDNTKTAFVKYGFSSNEQTWLKAPIDSTEVFKEKLTSHFVRLKNLPANSAIYYRVCESKNCSEPFWFKTAPTDNQPFVMIAGGDTRTGWENRKKGFRLVAKIRPLFIMHGGDYTGSNSHRRLRQYFDEWALTFSNDTIDGIAYKRVYPVIPTHGNHEDNEYKTLCQVFGIDFNGDNKCNTDDTYGAFNISPLLRAYTLNTQYQQSGWSTEASEQNTWLQNDMQTKGKTTLWRFAQFHKSIFPHNSAKDENLGLFNWWANTFYDNALNLVIESDTHINKITKAVKPQDDSYEVTENGGTVFVGEGSWGADARSADKSYPWTIDMASIQQFKVLVVSADKVELRTALFDDTAEPLTRAAREKNPTLLPENITWWQTKGLGEVLTLERDINNRTLLQQANFKKEIINDVSTSD